MTKKQFYATRLWKDTRQQVLHDALFTCADCNSRASEVHHVTALTEANVDDWNISLNPNNLLALCTSCHSKRTNGYTGDVGEQYRFNEYGEVVKA